MQKNLISLTANYVGWVICLVALFHLWSAQVSASTVTVQASIPDTQAPSAPILIAPEDEDLLSDSTPTFSWYEATDNMGVSHYVLYIDDDVFYDFIPLYSTNNSDYSLEYDSLEGSYELTIKDRLRDGKHEWRIVAVDYADLEGISDTWEFRLDTQAPSFVLNKIGDTSVSISASSPSSVPSSPIIIFSNDPSANEPMLLATGEAGSRVKLTITIPGDTTQSITKTIGSGGSYEVQLGILPRDTDIRLDFIITDAAGQVSVLEKVYFRIALQYWPTATPSTLTPTPSVSIIVSPAPSISSSPSPLPTATPSINASPSPTPTGIIPIIPPREIIHQGVDEVVERLPEGMAESIRAFLSSSWWQGAALHFNMFLLVLFYVSAFVLLASKFWTDFSRPMFAKVCALLWPTINQSWENLVVEYRETNPAALIRVELLNEQKQVVDWRISNRSGNFNHFDVSALRSWSLSIKDHNFYYPIEDTKPDYVDFFDFYQGQAFDHQNYHGEPVVIPTLRAAGQTQLPFLERLRLGMLYLLEYPGWFYGCMVFLGLIFALRYPSISNSIALCFYLVLGVQKYMARRRWQNAIVFASQTDFIQHFTGKVLVSVFDRARHFARVEILPFDFAQSKPLYHAASVVKLKAWARNFQAMPLPPHVSEKIPLVEKITTIKLQIKKN